MIRTLFFRNLCMLRADIAAAKASAKLWFLAVGWVLALIAASWVAIGLILSLLIGCAPLGFALSTAALFAFLYWISGA